jgi:hypothetical protein
MKKALIALAVLVLAASALAQTWFKGTLAQWLARIIKDKGPYDKGAEIARIGELK